MKAWHIIAGLAALGLLVYAYRRITDPFKASDNDETLDNQPGLVRSEMKLRGRAETARVGDPIPLIDVLIERGPPFGQGYITVAVPAHQAKAGTMIPGLGRVVRPVPPTPYIFPS
jgi:hypothetical protein